MGIFKHTKGAVMIGVEVYYIEDNVIKRSGVIATELRELGESSIVILTLRSGKKVEMKDACLTMQDVFVKLKREFEEHEKFKQQMSANFIKLDRIEEDELIKTLTKQVRR